MRPRQWTKNSFVFTAVLFDQKLFLAGPFLKRPFFRSLAGFVLRVLDGVVLVEVERFLPVAFLAMGRNFMQALRRGAAVEAGVLQGRSEAAAPAMKAWRDSGHAP